MKQPFRFFRGEFNGSYILAFLLCKNEAVQDIIEELVYWTLMTWKLEEEVAFGELPVRDSDIEGLAKFAGVFRPLQYIENTNGSIKFTSSNVVGGKERSDRGLFNMADERFEFVRTANDSYLTDIATEATANKRAPLIPDGQVPIGYIPYGVDIFDSGGNLIPGALLSEPPIDGTPYAEYYGSKFLTTEIAFITNTAMSIEAFKNYFECIMRIRQNGASVTELLYLTQLFGEGYIKDLEIVPIDYYYALYYTLDDTSDVPQKSSKVGAWKATIEKRFKDFVLVERIGG